MAKQKSHLGDTQFYKKTHFDEAVCDTLVNYAWELQLQKDEVQGIDGARATTFHLARSKKIL